MEEEDKKRQNLKEILLKDPNDRTSLEISFLSVQIGSFFASYKTTLSEALYLEIFRTLRLESFKKFQVVFHYGETGKKIYYILKGEVYVLVPKIYDVNDHSALTLSNVHKNLLPTSEAQILHEYPSFLIRTVLSEGFNFGEVALIIKGCRNSTIICKEDCDLMVLHAETYEKIKRKNVRNYFTEKMEFLTEIPLFNQWRRTNISLIMFYLTEVTFSRGQFIYKEDEDVSGVYIIVDGEIELFRSVSQKNKEGQFLRTKKSLISVARLTKGQNFGDEEIFERAKRIYYARCLSTQARLYLFTKKDLFDNIKSMIYLKQMKNDADKKIEHREAYFQRKLELINHYKSQKGLIKPKPEDPKPKSPKKRRDETRTSVDFSFRSNLIQSFVSEAEKKPNKKDGLSMIGYENTNQGLSQLLKRSVISHLVNNVPKFKNKFISLHEKKMLEKNYESDLSNKIRLIVEKRLESSLTQKKMPPKREDLKITRPRPKSTETLILEKRSKDSIKKKLIDMKIKSYAKCDKKLLLAHSMHFKEEGKPTLKDGGEYLFNFILKQKPSLI